MKKFLFLAAVLAVFMAMVVSATSTTYNQTILTPAVDTTITGTITLTAEVNGTSYNCNVAGCQSQLSNVTYVNISYTQVTPTSGTKTLACSNSTNINNGTFANWTCTFDTTALSDLNSYTFTADIANNTKVINSSANVRIRVDNTLPTSSIDNTENSALTSGSITATVSRASYCRIIIGTSSMDFNMTLNSAGTQCSYTPDKNVVPDSTYSVTVTAYDPQSNSTAAVKSLTIDLRDNAASGGGLSKATINKVVQTSQQAQKKNTTILIVVVVAAYLVVTGKLKNQFK